MRILLIEDDVNLCKLLQFQLEKEHHQVDLCHDGRDGLDLFLEDAHDLILLDRMLPTMNGLLVLKKARQAGISTPVIMITALGELYDRIEGLDGGADDYIVKPFEVEELTARIRSLGRRTGKWEADNSLHFCDISYDCASRMLYGPGDSLRLSGREGCLLETFIRNPNTLFRRSALLFRVWGTETEVEESNLDTYIHYLRKRLSYVGSRLHLKTIRGIGYQLEE